MTGVESQQLTLHALYAHHCDAHCEQQAAVRQARSIGAEVIEVVGFAAAAQQIAALVGAERVAGRGLPTGSVAPPGASPSTESGMLYIVTLIVSNS
jgi:hypothetical protein